MKKIFLILLLVCLFSNCSKQNKNVKELGNEENKTQEFVAQEKKEKSEEELLLDKLLVEAYENDDYEKCIEILQRGSDGRTDYLLPDCPLLLAICQTYLDNNEKSQKIESLFDFYVKNRKAAFEDNIEVALENRGYIGDEIYPTQTVGSYLSRFANVELLWLLVQEKININSPNEGDKSAIYELSVMDSNFQLTSRVYRHLVINAEEKRMRMELLLDAGADVTAVNNVSGATIFHFFRWFPFEEDYAGLLDRLTEKGADLFKKDRNGYSCIQYAVDAFALDYNTEAYLEYLISRGLEVVGEDLGLFNSRWSGYMKSADVTEEDITRLKKIKTILEKNLKQNP